MAKQGRSLQELAAELERQSESQKDYIAPQGKIEAVVVDGEVVVDGLNGKNVGITPYAHGQIAQHLEIPKAYYDRMLDQDPELLTENINTWLHRDGANKRFVRTLDGRIRAFLSTKFRPLDNWPLANAVMPTLFERKVKIISSELTDTRMYIKGILPELSDQLPAGQAWGEGHTFIKDQRLVVAAVTISNSDVGAGTLRVEPSVFQPACTNLAALVRAAMKKYHVGRTVQSVEEDGSYEVFTDDTRMADEKAFWLKVRDILRAAFDPQAFKEAIESLKAAAVAPIVSDDLPKVVEVTVKRLALPQSAGVPILKHLAAGGDLTQFGLASAITRTANDWADYEGATELEHAGGKVLALEGGQWKALAEAA